MVQFQASSPTDQVSGASIRAYVGGLGFYGARGLQILSEVGISDPHPGQWYSWQAYLDAQRLVYERVGPSTVGRIGRKLVEEADIPPSISSIHAALSTLDADYRTRHRGKEVGYFRYEKTGERACTLTIRNPYPCELDRNVVEALCRRFKPADAPAAHVRHADEGSCRKHGAEACVLHIRW